MPMPSHPVSSPSAAARARWSLLLFGMLASVVVCAAPAPSPQELEALRQTLQARDAAMDAARQRELALLKERGCVAFKALEGLNMTYDKARDAIASVPS